MKVSDTVSSQQVDQMKSQPVESTQQVKQKQEAEKLAEKEQNQKQKKKEEAKQATKEEVKKAVEKLNETVQPFHEDLQFEIHETTDRMMAKVVNTEKNETIKEMPPKELLDTLGRIRKFVGLILDEKI